MIDLDTRAATMHLMIAVALIIVALYVILDDLDRLHRITAPRLVFVRDPGVDFEGEIIDASPIEKGPADKPPTLPLFPDL